MEHGAQGKAQWVPRFLQGKVRDAQEPGSPLCLLLGTSPGKLEKQEPHYYHVIHSMRTPIFRSDYGHVLPEDQERDGPSPSAELNILTYPVSRALFSPEIHVKCARAAEKLSNARGTNPQPRQVESGAVTPRSGQLLSQPDVRASFFLSSYHRRSDRCQDARASGPSRRFDVKTSLNSLGRMHRADTQVPHGNPGQPCENGRKIIYRHFPPCSAGQRRANSCPSCASPSSYEWAQLPSH